jgi:plasmid stability protein
MPVNLSIKNAPDDVVELVRERAQKNHRSLRGELLAIIEEAVRPPRPARMSIDDILAQGRRLGLETPSKPPSLTARELLAEVRKLGLRTPSDSVDIIRAMRDERHGR